MVKRVNWIASDDSRICNKHFITGILCIKLLTRWLDRAISDCYAKIVIGEPHDDASHPDYIPNCSRWINASNGLVVLVWQTEWKLEAVTQVFLWKNQMGIVIVTLCIVLNNLHVHCTSSCVNFNIREHSDSETFFWPMEHWQITCSTVNSKLHATCINLI